MSEERREEVKQKSLATRRANKKAKEVSATKAKELRKQADDFIKQAEKLRQQADEIDGESSSDKFAKKRAAEIKADVEKTFRDAVSPQYLKQMVAYAINRGMWANQLTTPTYTAMDITNNSDASAKERHEANRILAQLEIAKPKMTEDEAGDTVGSVESEMDKLLDFADEISVKNWED